MPYLASVTQARTLTLERRYVGLKLEGASLTCRGRPSKDQLSGVNTICPTAVFEAGT